MPIDPFANCHFEILPEDCTLDTCCLAQSSFLYLPNFGGNLFFTIFFGVFILPHIWLGWRYRTVGFTIGMISCLILEVIGYAARVWLHDEPFLDTPFLIYLICLTIGPVFLTAAIYLCLTRIIVIFSPATSRLAPRTIAITFMTLDFLALLLQAIGGAIADTANTEDEASTRQAGLNTMVAGLVLQCLTIAAFMLYCGDFFLKLHRKGGKDMDAVKVSIRQRWVFKAFLGALALATVAVLIRSIFRAAELWEGFEGELWNDETDFMVLDGMMIALAVVCLTVLQPGMAFGGQWGAGNWTFKTGKGKGAVGDGGSGEGVVVEESKGKSRWMRMLPGRE